MSPAKKKDRTLKQSTASNGRVMKRTVRGGTSDNHAGGSKVTLRKIIARKYGRIQKGVKRNQSSSAHKNSPSQHDRLSQSNLPTKHARVRVPKSVRVKESHYHKKDNRPGHSGQERLKLWVAIHGDKTKVFTGSDVEVQKQLYTEARAREANRRALEELIENTDPVLAGKRLLDFFASVPTATDVDDGEEEQEEEEQGTHARVEDLTKALMPAMAEQQRKRMEIEDWVQSLP